MALAFLFPYLIVIFKYINIELSADWKRYFIYVRLGTPASPFYSFSRLNTIQIGKNHKDLFLIHVPGTSQVIPYSGPTSLVNSEPEFVNV